MAPPTPKEVATFVKDIFPATFDGSSGIVDSAIDATVKLVKPKCTGVAHALATSACSIQNSSCNKR